MNRRSLIQYLGLAPVLAWLGIKPVAAVAAEPVVDSYTPLGPLRPEMRALYVEAGVADPELVHEMLAMNDEAMQRNCAVERVLKDGHTYAVVPGPNAGAT